MQIDAFYFVFSLVFPLRFIRLGKTGRARSCYSVLHCRCTSVLITSSSSDTPLRNLLRSSPIYCASSMFQRDENVSSRAAGVELLHPSP